LVFDDWICGDMSVDALPVVDGDLEIKTMGW